MARMDNVYQKMVEDFNINILPITKDDVAFFEKEGDANFIRLEYGTAKYRFRLDGYNNLYIMNQLYNNNVTDALME